DSIQNGACYIRVSTDEQTEFSPDAQLKALKNYAKLNNIILTKEHIYIDEGISGKRADKRPQFMKMIGTAKQKPKPFDVILVHKFDRFARSREDSIVYKSLLKRECDVKVVSITESIENDKFSVILEAMLEAMAEYYSLNLAEEVTKGMTEKAERGEFQSRPPLGYRIENKKLKIIEEEASLVRIIFNYFINRENSLFGTIRYANTLGKSKLGGDFSNHTINYILNNPTYIGKVRWTPHGGMNNNFNHPNMILRDSDHEPIIDMETWDKVQERLRENKELFRQFENKNSPITTWLKGLMKCGACGRSIIIHREKYMQCNAYFKGSCKVSAHTKIDILENAVLEELKKTYTGEIELNIVPSATEPSTALEYDVLNDRLSKITSKENRVEIAYEDGIDSLSEYKEKKQRLSDEREDLINALELLKGKLIENRHNNEIVKKITDVYELLTDESIDIEQKYQTAHFLIEKITYSKPEKTLKLVYK
ncbi:MAG: recombinase family protein, partial [Oscillospiraceae bacterium]|nr:recombinase family protein [Oscillospiraceae bacterium]